MRLQPDFACPWHWDLHCGGVTYGVAWDSFGVKVFESTGSHFWLSEFHSAQAEAKSHTIAALQIELEQRALTDPLSTVIEASEASHEMEKLCEVLLAWEDRWLQTNPWSSRFLRYPRGHRLSQAKPADGEDSGLSDQASRQARRALWDEFLLTQAEVQDG